MKYAILKSSLIELFVKRKHKGKDIIDEVKAVISLTTPYLDAAEKWNKLNSIPEAPGDECEKICPLSARCEGDDECLLVVLILAIEDKVTPTLGMRYVSQDVS